MWWVFLPLVLMIIFNLYHFIYALHFSMDGKDLGMGSGYFGFKIQ